MLSFLSIALLTYGGMHLYALGKLWRVLPHSGHIAALLVLAGVVLTLSPMLVHFLENKGWRLPVVAWTAYLWMSYVFLFFCVGIAFDVVHAAASLSKLKWPLTEAGSLGFVALLAAMLVGWGVIEASRIRIERITIETPKIPPGQRITLAQLSDLHLGLMLNERFLGGIVAQLQTLKPDIVIATGDIVDREGDNLPALAKLFLSYRPPFGAYAVTGNHEHYAGLPGSLRFLEDSGFRVLRDESVHAGGITLTGLDDPAALAFGQSAPHRPQPAANENEFVVLLKHQPVVEDAPRFDLQLSGHVHGGQIFPVAYLTRMIYKFDTGLTRMPDGRLLYVSRGTGTWGPPVRLFAPPEIALITLTGTSSASGNTPRQHNEERP